VIYKLNLINSQFGRVLIFLGKDDIETGHLTQLDALQPILVRHFFN